MNNIPPNSPNGRYNVVVDTEVSVVNRQRAIVGALLIGGAAALFGFSKYIDSVETASEEVAKAEASKTEMVSGESKLMAKYGGETYKMKRLPGMAENHPDAKGNVYIRIPEKPESNRVVVFLHGGGGMQFIDKDGNLDVNIENMVKCTDKLNLPLIAPQDGWAGTKAGNWNDFNDPKFATTLIRFFEDKTGESMDDILIATFSSGNIGLSKWLTAIQKSDDSDAERLYKRISRITLFDSADGQERESVTKWMDTNSDATLFSCYFEGNKTYTAGNNLLLKALKDKKISDDRREIVVIPKKENSGHAIKLDICLKAVERK